MIGEILVHGPHVLEEFVRETETASDRFLFIENRKYLRTGDLGYVDEAGTLFLLGRAREIGSPLFSLPFELWCDAESEVEAGAVIMLKEQACGVIVPAEGAKQVGLEKRILRRARESGFPLNQVLLAEHLPRDRRHESRVDYEALASSLRRSNIIRSND